MATQPADSCHRHGRRRFLSLTSQQRRWTTGIVACGFFAAALPAYALCPIAVNPTARAESTSPIWNVGEPINVSVKTTFSKVTAVCFDKMEVLAPGPLTVENGTAAFSVTIPETGTRRAGPLSTGDHELTVLLNDDNGQFVAARIERPYKPKLESVGVIRLTARDQSFRVSLKGDDFDESISSNYRILMNGFMRDTCWSDAECVTSPQSIRGAVVGEHEIVLSKMDPVEEAKATFQVCYGDEAVKHCSETVSDADAGRAHFIVLACSTVIMVVAIAVIVFLVWLRRGALTIWGRTYIATALLIDNETDTYSLSKLQFYIWTAVAVFAYAYLTISRIWYQHWVVLPPVPVGLPGIIGIAGGAAVGAQVITQIKGPKGSGQLHPSFADFITSGQVVSAERVQFLVWTFIGAVGFLLVIAHLDPRTLVELPPVPESLLAISGMSVFGYLGGKLARDAGPVINQVFVSKGPDPDAVTGTVAGKTLMTAPASGVGGSAPSSSAQFRIIELRGRTLSQDSIIKVSRGPDSKSDDMQVMFDWLEPMKVDSRLLQQPRVVEQDSDAGRDKTLAKFLRLVIRLDSEAEKVFKSGEKRTISVTNPDSQKAMFQFDVP